MDTIQHNAARLYNCDETGITILQHKHTKILGLKGKRQIFSLQSAERGSLVTVVTCLSPTGHFIPPLLLFPKKIWNKNWWMAHRWINLRVPSLGVDTERDFFPQWFLHFIKHTKPTKEDPLILVSDRHYSHTRKLEVITWARENHVDIIRLPPDNSTKCTIG